MGRTACDNLSVGVIIRDRDNVLMIERKNYPQAYALPAGHVDEKGTPQNAMLEEAREEVGLEIIDFDSVVESRIDNPCKREGGDHHVWTVYEALSWIGKVQAGSDAKSYFWATQELLEELAARTEYFARKYKIPLSRVGDLTRAIFGADPAVQKTDPEWRKEMGLEPVWYALLIQAHVIL